MDTSSQGIELDLGRLQRAMEDEYRNEDEAFCMTEIIFDLQTTCPIHKCGFKDVIAQRYTCIRCGALLDKKLKNH